MLKTFFFGEITRTVMFALINIALSVTLICSLVRLTAEKSLSKASIRRCFRSHVWKAVVSEPDEPRYGFMGTLMLSAECQSARMSKNNSEGSDGEFLRITK